MTQPDAERLGRQLGGTVADLAPMLGGASSDIWSFSLDGRRLVLRRDAGSRTRASTLPLEAALLKAARTAGVPVPELVAFLEEPQPYLVMERLDGETLGRRILGSDVYAGARAALAAQCGRALACLHANVDPASIPGLPDGREALAALRAMLEPTGEPHPAFELGFLWLAAHPPAVRLPPAVVHGDFRLGNLIVDARGLAGVLDWELAHAGDPAEDLGWLCVRSWRFGGSLPVGGFGTRAELLAAYEGAGGAAVDEATLLWWETFGTLRWGIICVMQAARHLGGEVRSVELAAIGRRVCEVEHDLLNLIYGPAPLAEPVTAPPGVSPHDRPTAGELLVSVAEWIGSLPLGSRDAFLARVATRTLEIVRREVAFGSALPDAHARRLAQLGVADDADLAARIRSGECGSVVVDLVRAAVADKLRVADPAHLHAR